MARETYELYYSQNGRWQLHASYEPSEREKAIEDAKGIEAKEGFPTRVVRETFNSDSNTSEEVVTWQSTKAKAMNDGDSMFGEKKEKKQGLNRKNKPAPLQQQRPQQTEAPKAKAAPAKKAPARKQKPKSKKRGPLVRFLIVVIGSLALGIISLIAGSLIVAQMVSMRLAPPRDYTQIIVGGSVLIFFIALFFNLQRQFNILGALRGNRSGKQSAAGPAQMLAATAEKKKKAHVQDIEFDEVEIEDLRAKIEAEDAAAEEIAAEEEAPKELEESEPQDLGADMTAEVHGVEPPPEPPALQEAPAPLPEPVRTSAPAPKTEEKKPAPKPAAPEKSPAEVDARASLNKFVADAMRTAKPEPTNAFSRFGMNLYFAGGASVIGQTKRLDKNTQLAMLKDGLIAAGNTAERAENFCVELPSYGKNPKYTVMVQAGAKAMTLQMKGDGSAVADIGSVLNDWNLPEKRSAVPSVFTFVFTDIVGSTAMTQQLGNAGAQKAVRAHNTAVRGALQKNRGREVKHTGDGIMAVFPDPVSAVQATIQMQREIFAHNGANPSIPVSIRVGVNVGEAVEEDNDFFGAAVQMTARICDKASKGNIWVSQAVKDACKGQKIGFIPRGKFEMKGIQGSKPLFEVGWSDAHKNELADQ